MSKSISCLCNSKHIKTKVSIKKQFTVVVINNTSKRKLQNVLQVKILFIIKKNLTANFLNTHGRYIFFL